MLNNTTIEGNLTGKPTITKAGNSEVCKLRIAQSTYQGKNKDRKSIFVNLEAWGSTAKHIADSYDKGHRIVVEGSLDYDEWTDKDGNKRQRNFIKVKEVHSRPQQAAA